MDGTTMSQLVARWDGLIGRQRFQEPSRAPAPVLRSGSVLLPGASEAEIVAAELRLGIRFPPSYRAFLATSNGAYAGPWGMQDPDLVAGRFPVEPSALLPADAVDRSVRWPGPSPVDLTVGELSMSRPHGHDAVHMPGYGRPGAAESDYLSAPLLTPWTDFKAGHLWYTITIGWFDGYMAVLDPMVVDGRGEWELVKVEPGGDARYPSFGAWLETTVEDLTDGWHPAPEPLVRSDDEDIWDWLDRLVREIPVAPELAPLESALVEVIVDRGEDPAARRFALDHVRSLDLRDGGDRFAPWINRVSTEPAFDDIEVITLVSAASRSGGGAGLPTVAEQAALGRRADLCGLDRLPTRELEQRYRAAPDPVLAELLTDRGSAMVVGPARAVLHHLMTAHPEHRVEHPGPTLTGIDLCLTADDLLGTLADLQREHPRLPAEPAGRALARAGFADAAVAYLEERLDLDDDWDLLYPIAAVDRPRSWVVLDRIAAMEPDVRHHSGVNALLAAGRTRSPLLPARATVIVEAGQALAPIALLALELQQTTLATTALRRLWHNGHLGALRALARRRHPGVTADCVLLLHDPDPEIRLVGAETLRDLGDPDTVDDVVAALRTATDDQLVTVLAHTLAATGRSEVAGLIRSKAAHTENAGLAALLVRWADQLTLDLTVGVE
ncbi:MAG: SMI1/KNR4 family protein [Acidimicrobiales bacterium]